MKEVVGSLKLISDLVGHSSHLSSIPLPTASQKRHHQRMHAFLSPLDCHAPFVPFMLGAIPMFLGSYVRLKYELEQKDHEGENIPPASRPKLRQTL